MAMKARKRKPQPNNERIMLLLFPLITLKMLFLGIILLWIAKTFIVPH